MSSLNIQLPLDFSYLYEISDNDRDFIKDMLATIVKNTPQNIKEINQANEDGKWGEVGRLVHKLKPSILLMNIEELNTLIRALENNAKASKNLDDIKKQVTKLNEFCDLLLSEINEALTTDTY
ncbi:MAG: Hpt domain-containing protein [Reichenbachiella sp.]